MRIFMIIFLVSALLCPALSPAQTVSPAQFDSLSRRIQQQLDSSNVRLGHRIDSVAALKTQRELSLDAADRTFQRTLTLFTWIISVVGITVSGAGIYIGFTARRIDESRKKFDERLLKLKLEDENLAAKRTVLDARVSELNARVAGMLDTMNRAEEYALQIEEKRARVDTASNEMTERLSKLVLTSETLPADLRNQMAELSKQITELQGRGKEPTANDLYLRGSGQYFDHLYDAALVSFEQALSLKKDFAEAWLLRGRTMEMLERPVEDQLTSYEKAIQANPRLATAWANKGWALGRLNRLPEQEMAAYEKAIECDPKLAIAWNNKGWLLGRLKKPLEEQLAAYEKAIECDPKLALAWNNKGWLLGKLKKPLEEQLAAYEKAIECDPKLALAWNNKGFVLGKLKRSLEAQLAAYEKAIEYKPRYALAFYNRAYAYALSKKKPEMLTDLKHTIDLDAKYKAMAKTDKDFKDYWEDEDFQKLVSE